MLSGEIRRNAPVRVIRNDEVLLTGEIASLKREKEDVREVREGMECGIVIKNFEDFEVADIIECFVMEKFGG